MVLSPVPSHGSISRFRLSVSVSVLSRFHLSVPSRFCLSVLSRFRPAVVPHGSVSRFRLSVLSRFRPSVLPHGSVTVPRSVLSQGSPSWFSLTVLFGSTPSGRLRAGVRGAAREHHLPRGVPRGPDHHALPGPGQPVRHLQVTDPPLTSTLPLIQLNSVFFYLNTTPISPVVTLSELSNC